MILDQEIEGRILPPQSPPLYAIRRELAGNGLATFLNQLDRYADVVASGESAYRHLQEWRVKTASLLSQLSGVRRTQDLGTPLCVSVVRVT
jgi:hypothetical protein